MVEQRQHCQFRQRYFTKETVNILWDVDLHFMGALPILGKEDDLQSTRSEFGDLQLV